MAHCFQAHGCPSNQIPAYIKIYLQARSITLFSWRGCRSWCVLYIIIFYWFTSEITSILFPQVNKYFRHMIRQMMCVSSVLCFYLTQTNEWFVLSCNGCTSGHSSPPWNFHLTLFFCFLYFIIYIPFLHLWFNHGKKNLLSFQMIDNCSKFFLNNLSEQYRKQRNTYLHASQPILCTQFEVAHRFDHRVWGLRNWIRKT